MNQVQQFLEYVFNAVKIFIIVQPWETGVRVRCGKKVKKLKGGIHFRLPYFDSIFIQEARLRVSDISMQTLTTKDGKTITLNSALAYNVEDIETLYNTLCHPETTIDNIATSEAARFVFETELKDITPKKISGAVMESLGAESYGIGFKYYKITNFAVVKTFRLIQDQSWTHEGLDMSEKR